MATAPVITSHTLYSDGGVGIDFTHSGASTEKFYLERAITGLNPLEYMTVRSITRGSAVQILDYVAPLADLTVTYRIRVTNADGTGEVFSNTYDVTLVCKDYSVVSGISPYTIVNQLKMDYATSRDGTRGRNTNTYKFAGRQYPTAEKTMQRSNEVNITWYVKTWLEYEKFCQLMLDKDFWYKDNSGRSFHAVCSDIDIKDSQVLNGYTLSTTLTRIDGGVTN